MDNRTLNIAFDIARRFKKHTIDEENHVITFPFSSGRTLDDVPEIMSDGCVGKWYADNGFSISFEVRDVEYTTKPIFNTRSMTGYRGHTAFLRNRLVATITW